MGAFFLLLWCDRSGRFAARHRIASHRIFESWRREDKRQTDRFRANFFQTYPSVSRNENKSSGMKIPLLIAEPHVSRSAMHQRNFVLDQMPVLRQGRSGSKPLGPRHEMLRAVVFRADLQHE